MDGVDQVTCADVGDVASTWSDRGADGNAKGMTSADVVLFTDSTTDVLVTVTTLVS